jgi:hypothetical protein
MKMRTRVFPAAVFVTAVSSMGNSIQLPARARSGLYNVFMLGRSTDRLVEKTDHMLYK